LNLFALSPAGALARHIEYYTSCHASFPPPNRRYAIVGLDRPDVSAVRLLHFLACLLGFSTGSRLGHAHPLLRNKEDANHFYRSEATQPKTMPGAQGYHAENGKLTPRNHGADTIAGSMLKMERCTST
jgi:hypothetical protein